MILNDFDDWVSKNKDLWDRLVGACNIGDNNLLKMYLDQIDSKKMTYYADCELMSRLFEITMATKEYICLEQLLQFDANVNGWDIGEVIGKRGLPRKAIINKSMCLKYLLGLSKLKYIDSVWSYLHTACSSENADAVKLLLKCGANVDVKCGIRGNTPYHYALRNHFRKPTPETKEIMQLLLMAGSNVFYDGFEEYRIAILKMRIDAMCD